MGLRLRPFQEDLIDRARQSIRKGSKNLLIVAPTGAGKTVLSASILGSGASRGNRSWFINHRRELIRQSCRTFERSGIGHGVIASGFPANDNELVQVCGIQTLTNRLDDVRPPKTILWDEAHHVAAGGWASVFSLYPDVVHIGVTATPCRLDGMGLGEWFGEMIEGPTVRWLIDEGYLCNYRLFAPPSIDTSDLRRRGNDFRGSDIDALVAKSSIHGDVVEQYFKKAAGKRAVVFAPSVHHSQAVADRFNAAGIPAIHLDGTTDAGVRDLAIQAFERGDIKVLTNVDLFGEGFDVPAIEVVILMRPTMSVGLYLQQIGRALRPIYADGFDLNTRQGRLDAIAASAKPFAIVLDHVGNWEKHGLPDDEREWSLDSKVKQGKVKDADEEPEVKIRQCPSCYEVHKPSPACPFCGHHYQAVRKLEQVEGDLVEVDKEAARRQARREQAAAKTLEDLIQLAERKNYKNPRKWASIIMDSRNKKAENRGSGTFYS
jgi:DNA repair protein RadD